jgi:hypothetical protein
MARKFLFMRCICIWLGKVAGAWIWLQTITIKCGDNEWGYPSKPLHMYWAFKGPSRRKLLTISTKTEFKCRTLNVNQWNVRRTSTLTNTAFFSLAPLTTDISGKKQEQTTFHCFHLELKKLVSGLFAVLSVGPRQQITCQSSLQNLWSGYGECLSAWQIQFAQLTSCQLFWQHVPVLLRAP